MYPDKRYQSQVPEQQPKMQGTHFTIKKGPKSGTRKWSRLSKNQKKEVTLHSLPRNLPRKFYYMVRTTRNFCFLWSGTEISGSPLSTNSSFMNQYLSDYLVQRRWQANFKHSEAQRNDPNSRRSLWRALLKIQALTVIIKHQLNIIPQ